MVCVVDGSVSGEYGGMGGLFGFDDSVEQCDMGEVFRYCGGSVVVGLLSIADSHLWRVEDVGTDASIGEDRVESNELVVSGMSDEES